MSEVWSFMGKVDLKIDWATHEAAKYACEHWHYSKRMVATIQKPAKIGVWENGLFAGVVVFGCGASSDLGSQYGLKKMEIAELVRIALKDSHATPVTRIVSIALRIIKKSMPGLRLIVSFADSYQNHIGAIYQAGNWIYTGITAGASVYISKDGHEFHARNIGAYTGRDKYGVKKYAKAEMASIEKRPGKYRYLMPLDDEMRKRIEPLRKPYPKRVTKATSGDQLEGGGAIPTHALQNKRDKQAIGSYPEHSDGAAPIVTLQNNNEVPNAENP